MVQQLPNPSQQEVIYPDSDGQPMADNTKQFNWIVKIKENLEILFANEANVFVAGDLLWYPVEGDNKIRKAPDAMVIFGRPKMDRGSYQQWLEDNIAPQVVFEILSPGNTLKEMAEKLEFYDQYGVEEYYLYDPDKVDFNGWLRSDNRLKVINPIEGLVSPRLKVRFELTEAELEIYRPDSEIFLTSTELARKAQQERKRAQQAQQQAQQERQRAEQAEARIQILETRLRELGVDMEDL